MTTTYTAVPNKQVVVLPAIGLRGELSAVLTTLQHLRTQYPDATISVEGVVAHIPKTQYELRYDEINFELKQLKAKHLEVRYNLSKNTTSPTFKDGEGRTHWDPYGGPSEFSTEDLITERTRLEAAANILRIERAQLETFIDKSYIVSKEDW